ncbi:MAG: isochorismatase family protein [Firmicutes bacterium]|nr:isochorismatase family protein [Bacillota bacterium]MCM1400454.1 isochorismatase family protein [Bacteroides sp.]MCM1476906.1 isochorismatase family protein [Bacteroides sp.]
MNSHIPLAEVDKLPAVVKEMFITWRDFLFRRVKFNMPDSPIHAAYHCERVLMYALMVAWKEVGDDKRVLNALAHASVFHDTRRQDEYLDTGHGARAAVYYSEFCRGNSDVEFMPEAELAMRYHDIDDKTGIKAIRDAKNIDTERALLIYKIFKDADALDRWRLGNYGLDRKFLRTASAKTLADYSKRIVNLTMCEQLRNDIEQAVNKSMAPKRRLLLVVDPQVDFINGSLAVDGAERAMNKLAEFISQSNSRYVHKIVTADCHPYNHFSFAEQGGPWPRHCVADTVGAALWQPVVDALYSTEGGVTVLHKGMDAMREEYSIFKNAEAAARIARIIEEARIEEVEICGIAGDVCVLNTLFDGMKLFPGIEFVVLKRFSPSIDGGEKLSEAIRANNLSHY